MNLTLKQDINDFFYHQLSYTGLMCSLKDGYIYSDSPRIKQACYTAMMKMKAFRSRLDDDELMEEALQAISDVEKAITH